MHIMDYVPIASNRKPTKVGARIAILKGFNKILIKWTSNNEYLDNFIRRIQLKTRCFEEFIE